MATKKKTTTKEPTIAQRRKRESAAMRSLLEEISDGLARGKYQRVVIDYSKARRKNTEWPRVPINIRITQDDPASEERAKS